MLVATLYFSFLVDKFSYASKKLALFKKVSYFVLCFFSKTWFFDIIYQNFQKVKSKIIKSSLLPEKFG